MFLKPAEIRCSCHVHETKPPENYTIVPTDFRFCQVNGQKAECMAEAAKIEGPWNAVRRVRICQVTLSRTDTG